MSARARLEAACGTQTPAELIRDLNDYRAEVLREAAASLKAVANPATERGAGVGWAADWVRSMADTRGPNFADDDPDVEAVS